MRPPALVKNSQFLSACRPTLLVIVALTVNNWLMCSQSPALTITAGRPAQERQVLTLDHGLVTGASHNCEGPVPHVLLHHRVAEVATNQALGIEHCVPGVHGHLVLGWWQQQTGRWKDKNAVRARGVKTFGCCNQP